VYARHKHPFTAPPATLKTRDRLHEMTQEHLRGPALDAVPFFERAAVTALLDQLPALDEGTRIGLDAAFLMILCTCLLQQRYAL
jgi:asparagine synthase (glutamine-hydrolysing)